MPRVPSVPDLDPVARPYASPQEFGRAGQIISQTAETALDSSLDELEIQGHIRKAQAHVDVLAAGNQLDALATQMQDQLAKTTNSRDVAGVLEQWEKDNNSVTAQWSKSPASVQIQLDAQSLMPRMGHLAQVKQIDLMGKEFDAQSTLQVQKMMPELVAAHRSGDTPKEQFIQQQISDLYEGAVQTGLMSEAEKSLKMNALQEAAQKQINEATITSSDPKERQQAIAQLKNGGDGPLDLKNLAPGDINAMRIHAEEMDHRINDLAEAHNLNNSLNIIANAFAAPEFKNNFEGQEKALQDGEWLKQHGIVSEDGQPDRVMAEKLLAETERARAARDKAQADNDEKMVEKYSPLIDENKMSRAQIDALPDELHGGISNHARALMVRQWTENWRINKSMDLQERAQIRQEKEDKSNEIAQQLLSAGVPLVTRSDLNSYILKGLSQRDANALWSTLDLQKDSGWQNAVKMFNASPVYNTSTDEGRAKLTHDTLQFARTVQSKSLTGSQITDELEKELHPQEEAIHSQTVKTLLDNIVPFAKQIITGVPQQFKIAPTETPERPKGVPPNAVWNGEDKQWQLPR